MSLPNNIVVRKRQMYVLLGFTIVMIALIVRVGWLQIVQGSELQKKAYENQTRDNKINPQRGTIYDRNGRELAISASVDTVTVNPNEVRNSKKIKPEEIAKTLSDILGMDEKDVLSKITKKTYYEVVKRKIDKDAADKIRDAQKDKKLPGISVVDDKKRFYPYSNFAAHVIGFTGDDNQGLSGIELKYDKYLRGIPGRIVSPTDATGREIPFSSEEYITPQNGYDVFLTIDEVIQHFTEKALETAVINNNVKKGTAIVMNPKTGEILGFAVKPDFDLNKPFEIADQEVKEKWDTLSNQEKNIQFQNMWRNIAISDTYEPGSTFKIITSAAALEEGAVKPTDMFNDIGYVVVANRRIHCWRSDRPHGIQTFVQGVQNSCNPVFIEVAQRIGALKFYNYIKGFGFMEKSQIDLPGETADSIFHKQSDIGPVELATYSFGQGFQVTPMQMLDAISAVANDGKLLRPKIVKEVKDKNGNVVQSFEPEFVRQVISKETSDLLRNILESVVSEGTGKNAYIKGYRIAGKTGTSEKLPRGSGKYIASFAAFAPADDPIISVIVVLDEPTGGVYYGGQIAAPVVGQIVDDTLRYLEVEPRYSPEEMAQLQESSVPEVRNMPLKEATKIIKDSGLTYKVEGEGDNVIEQMPRAGFKLVQNSPVYLFMNKSTQSTTRRVPDVKGKSITESSRILAEAGLNIKIRGMGYASSQTPAPGTEVTIGSVVNVEFINEDIAD